MQQRRLILIKYFILQSHNSVYLQKGDFIRAFLLNFFFFFSLSLLLVLFAKTHFFFVTPWMGILASFSWLIFLSCFVYCKNIYICIWQIKRSMYSILLSLELECLFSLPLLLNNITILYFVKFMLVYGQKTKGCRVTFYVKTLFFCYC